MLSEVRLKHLAMWIHNLFGRIQRGAGGPDPPPPEKSHNIGFPSNIDPDSLEITKLPSQHSMVGHYRHASEPPFKWRFAGGPLMAQF